MKIMFWFLFIVMSFIFTVAIFGTVNTHMTTDDRGLDLFIAIVVFTLLTVMNLVWYR